VNEWRLFTDSSGVYIIIFNTPEQKYDSMQTIRVLIQATIILIVNFYFTGKIYAQKDWQKHESNPVIDVGAGGSWDSRVSVPTSVIYHNGEYEAWLTGVDEMDIGRIGYAISADGIEWSKYENNPVVAPGNPGEWDDSNTDHACVYTILVTSLSGTEIQSNVYKVPTRGGDPVQLTFFSGNQVVSRPSFSPDGKSVAFSVL